MRDKRDRRENERAASAVFAVVASAAKQASKATDNNIKILINIVGGRFYAKIFSKKRESKIALSHR